ncbi:MAG: hypothetical protein AB7G11_16180, partial [Phycisphaerales bacterium]
MSHRRISTKTCRLVWSGCAIVAAGTLGAAALAQPVGGVDHGDAPAGASRESKASLYIESLAKLNSPIAMEREAAQEVLSNDPAFTLKQIEQSLRDGSLSGEQRCRLMQAARDRFFTSTRAAMGVQFSRLPLPERVVLERTYPQFPSFEVLQRGDMIIEVEGEQLRSRGAWDRLGAHIVSKDPGESLSLVIRRGEQKIPVEVKLGSYRDLPGNNGVDLAKYERAWELRSARYRTTSPEPIATGIPAGKWELGLTTPEEQKRIRIKMQMPTIYRPRLIAGGEPRGGEVDEQEQLEIWNAFNNGRINALDQRRIQNLLRAGMGGAPDFDSMVTMTVQQEIAGLEQYREQLRAALERAD